MKLASRKMLVVAFVAPLVAADPDAAVSVPRGGDAFVVPGDIPVRVTAWSLPDVAPAPEIRGCTVTFRLHEVATTVGVTGCTGAFHDAVDAAVKSWRVEAEPPKAGVVPTATLGVYAFPDGRIRAVLWTEPNSA